MTDAMKTARAVLTGGAALAALAWTLPAAAQQTTAWSASVRPRFESRTISGGSSTAFTGMQTRLSLARTLSERASLFVQLQDVRLWGEETRTSDGSADLFDLHQAYFELGQRTALWARIGRQEMQFADGRLVGTPPWSNVGQSFDGVRGAFAPTESTTVDAFAMQIREADAGPGAFETTFAGVWTDTRVGEDGSLQLFALHDRVQAPDRTARTTAGLYFTSSLGTLSYRVEGALQGGQAAGLDVHAHMLALEGGWVVDEEGRGTVTLWYDRYSGDANPAPGETGAFSDLYGRNHRFFGYADLLKNIPEDTGGRGLQDLALKLGYEVLPGTTLGADLHRFLVTDAAGLDDGLLANELDLYAKGPLLEGVDFLTGLSRVELGAAGTAVGLADGNVTLAYLQLRAAF